MSSRNTIIVLILLLIIGGYALYVNHQPPPPKNPKVYQIDAKDIRRIELTAPGRDLVMERGKGDEWKIVKPLPAQADQTTVQGIANEIAGLEITDTAEEHPGELAPFGLAKPAVTVTVTLKSGKTLPSILVGKQAPVGSSGFIKVADKPAVLMVSTGFAAEVNKHLDDVRSRQLFTFKPEGAQKIVITRGSDTLALDHSGPNWKITKPRDYPADPTAITAMLGTLDRARIEKFVEDQPSDPAKYGLAHPSLTIALADTKDAAPEELSFGLEQAEASSNAVYARTDYGADHPVFTVGKDVFASVNKSFDDLRDKTVMHFDPAKVGRITFVGGPVDETIAATGKDQWKITAAGKTAAAELPVVTSLIDQLHNLKANKIVADPMTDPNKYGMVKPTVTITVDGKDGAQLDQLRASILEVTMKPESSDEKEQRKSFGYATTARDTAVFEVPTQAVIDLENTGNRLHADVSPTPSPTPSPSPSAPAAPKASPTTASRANQF